ncbi:unnamed protein product [Acanthoscelides obtectus]|uniref:Uncharacterized protein n=1 Tax=Acanthoscelides obtectus TaxID=200917 RepID=A0A9P0JPU8_ACAOB|nr:unnamed protein product [Acanthoscelides obtectus]CAK1625918.1 hypothetical protein AOBTE_LOCUS3468 [Acanthoscelides obtectus]
MLSDELPRQLQAGTSQDMSLKIQIPVNLLLFLGGYAREYKMHSKTKNIMPNMYPRQSSQNALEMSENLALFSCRTISNSALNSSVVCSFDSISIAMVEAPFPDPPGSVSIRSSDDKTPREDYSKIQVLINPQSARPTMNVGLTGSVLMHAFFWKLYKAV